MMPRHIDADQMIADTEAMKQVCEAIEIDGIIKYIEEHIATDVKEVKHGKWIIEQLKNGKTVCYCGRCGAGLQNRETRNYIDISDADYCPNCGAKMDEKE